MKLPVYKIKSCVFFFEINKINILTCPFICFIREKKFDRSTTKSYILQLRNVFAIIEIVQIQGTELLCVRL